MGQTATLYRIDKADFAKVIDRPNDFGLFKMTKGYEIFANSFDGLQFVLKKGLDKKNQEIAEVIFYPKTFIGEQIDWSKADFENLQDNFDFERQPVYYHDPAKVSEISELLDTISLDKFQKEFNHNELNKAAIYPGDIWNDKTEDSIAFNVRHMLIEFHRLKSIFKIAKENNEYVLSYVG
ncbi:MAG: hypothetical protein JWQ27_3112 [Ferruginibacter sp.]|nr:hypothetical protein [Ferruginibacter sp.]